MTTTDPRDTLATYVADHRAMLEDAGLDPRDPPAGYAVITAVRSRAPFTVGELMVLNGEFDREIGEDDRKPSKWDLDYEWFGTDYDAAARRSAEVTRA